MPFAPPFAETARKLMPLFGAPPAVEFTFTKRTAVPVVVATATPFFTVSPLTAPELVIPFEAPVETSSELIDTLFAATVRVVLRAGFVPAEIARLFSVKAVPWPQSVRLLESVAPA